MVPGLVRAFTEETGEVPELISDGMDWMPGMVTSDAPAVVLAGEVAGVEAATAAAPVTVSPSRTTRMTRTTTRTTTRNWSRPARP